MIKIEEKQLWELNNVMVLRTKVQQDLVDNTCKEMEEKIVSLGGKRVANPITATHSVEGNMADVEIIIPLDKPLYELGELYRDIFRIENAIKLSYTGDSQNIHKASEELQHYIDREKLQPVTPAYNVVSIKKEGTKIALKLTVYIGIKKAV